MGRLKRYASLTAAVALVLAAGIAITSAYATRAQTTNDNGTGNAPHGMMHGKWGMGRPAVSGTVSSISGSTITLSGKNGTTYTVDASKATVEKFADNAKTTASVSDIKNGDTLTVFGTVSGNNIAANKIVDGQLPARQAPAATGTISNINGNTFTVTAQNGTAYTVDASNAQIVVFKKAGTSLQNSGVQNNDQVIVFGTVSGDNIAATRIMDGAMQGNFGMMGKIGMMHR